jgi:hypothetical protein
VAGRAENGKWEMGATPYWLWVCAKSYGTLVSFMQVHPKITEQDFDEIISKVVSKYRNLNNSIQSFKQPEEISSILHSARDARNEIAHSLTKGLEGCIDVKVNDKEFIDEITNLIGKISDGDLIISSLLTLFNSDQFPNPEFLSGYKGKIINWVVEQ